MHPHKKKKKKRNKSSSTTSPSSIKKREPKLNIFVEKTLDFGQNPSAASTATSAPRRQYLANRYVVLSSDSNVSSVVDDIPSSASINVINDTFVPINPSSDPHSTLHRQLSSTTNTDTPVSNYGTPSSHSYNSSPPLATHVIPDFPIPLPISSTTFTSATTSTTTSITAVSLTTITSPTFVYTTISHSTPSHSPTFSVTNPTTVFPGVPYSTPLPSPPPPPATPPTIPPPFLPTSSVFRSDYEISAPPLSSPAHSNDEAMLPPPISASINYKSTTSQAQSCL